jgi:hypothetical protein
MSADSLIGLEKKLSAMLSSRATSLSAEFLRMVSLAINNMAGDGC